MKRYWNRFLNWLIPNRRQKLLPEMMRKDQENGLYDETFDETLGKKFYDSADKSITVHRQETIGEKLKSFLQSLLFWKGRSKGMIHTRDLEWGDLRFIFFPKGFEEKYGYLGTSIYDHSHYFKQIYPLVLAMDYEAKPKWCPRWFLRFFHVFGNDRSIVRVRNRKLSNLHRRLTKGIVFWDWKTKWSDYDLRISITGPEHLQNLADDIERGYYSRGRQKELVEQIKKLDPNANVIWGSVKRLEKQFEELKNKEDESNIRV